MSGQYIADIAPGLGSDLTEMSSAAAEINSQSFLPHEPTFCLHWSLCLCPKFDEIKNLTRKVLIVWERHSVVHSHLSRSYITALSLVESFPTRGFGTQNTPIGGSLWHKTAGANISGEAFDQ